MPLTRDLSFLSEGEERYSGAENMFEETLARYFPSLASH